MNISIVISSIVGGILIIAIATLSFRMSESSGNNTLYNMSKSRMDVIAEMVTYDIRNLGYRADDINCPAIVSADIHELTFCADIDNDGFTNRVTWRYDTTAEVESTPNPNDRMLIREVLMEDGPDEIAISLVVTKFEFTYFNVDNDTINPATELNQLSRIRLSIQTESEFSYGDKYARSAWERTFTPRNLNL